MKTAKGLNLRPNKNNYQQIAPLLFLFSKNRLKAQIESSVQI